MKKAELAEVVMAAQKGNKDAATALYMEYRERIWFFVRKSISCEDAVEDIVSETFVTAIERLPELRCAEAFGSWLYSIAYSRCLSYRSSEAGIARFEDVAELESAIESTLLDAPVELPSDYIENGETRARLREAIDSLKPEMRSAVIMYYFEEMSIGEVGSALGLSENAAKQRLFRARKKLTEKLKGLGGGKALCAVPLGAALCPLLAEGGGTIQTTFNVLRDGGAVKAAAVGIAAAVALWSPNVIDGQGGSLRRDPAVSEENALRETALSIITDMEDGPVDYMVESDSGAVLFSGSAENTELFELVLENSDKWKLSRCEQADTTLGDLDLRCTTLSSPATDAEMQVVVVPTSDGREKYYRLYLPDSDESMINIDLHFIFEEPCPVYSLWDSTEVERTEGL